MDLSYSALLASIRRRGGFPSTATTGTADADLLRLVNEELQTRLMADLMRVREEYFVQTKDYTISSSTQRYRIPSRAVGNKVRAVYLMDSTGAYLPLPRTTAEKRHDYNGGTSTEAYLVEGNDIVLIPGSTTSATTLRVKFYIRPSEVSSSATAYTFTAVNLTTGVCTTSVNHGFTTSSTLDLLSASPGGEVLAFDLTPTVAATNSLTFTASQLPQTLAIGDKVIAYDTATSPQIPAEYHPVLAQRVVVKVFESLGKHDEMVAAEKELQTMEAAAMSLISPRSDAQPRKIFNSAGVLGPGYFRGGLLRRGG